MKAALSAISSALKGSSTSSAPPSGDTASKTPKETVQEILANVTSTEPEGLKEYLLRRSSYIAPTREVAGLFIEEAEATEQRSRGRRLTLEDDVGKTRKHDDALAIAKMYREMAEQLNAGKSMDSLYSVPGFTQHGTSLSAKEHRQAGAGYEQPYEERNEEDLDLYESLPF